MHFIKSLIKIYIMFSLAWYTYSFILELISLRTVRQGKLKVRKDMVLYKMQFDANPMLLYIVPLMLCIYLVLVKCKQITHIRDLHIYNVQDVSTFRLINK